MLCAYFPFGNSEKLVSGEICVNVLCECKMSPKEEGKNWREKTWNCSVVMETRCYSI